MKELRGQNINNKRQQYILDELSMTHYVTVSELSKSLKVSAVTIRKDLKHLEKIGKLYRIHGGATRESFIVEEKNINKKESIGVDDKTKIAKAAVKLINNNDFIILASGTTVQYMAAEIGNNFEKLTILSASLKTSLLIYDQINYDIIQLGGDIRKSSGSIMGPSAEQMIDNHSCNKLFMGADGVDFDFGVSTSSGSEAKLNQLMIEHSEKIILLVDSSKIGKRGFGKITDLEKIHVIITDKGISKKHIDKLEDLGIELIIAE